jgi:SAM-dependent methyltransferase
MASRVARQYSPDELRALYDQAYVDRYDPHAVRRITRMLPRFALTGAERVLDVGCGNGVLADVIAGRVAEYVGVDFSPVFIDAARARAGAAGLRNARFECADVVRFCADRRQEFDAAFALDVAEHIYDDELGAICQAVRASLRAGGRFYLHMPNGEYVIERLRRRRVLRQIEGHVAVRPPGEYVRLLTGSGFERIEVAYLAHYLPIAGALHPLGALPVVGPLLRARLFITCRA